MNWGTKIILGMATFMLFIIGMVTYMFKVHGNDALIDEDYYENGINYNKEYEAKSNVITDQMVSGFNVADNKIVITLKEAAVYKLDLLRPSAAKQDLHLTGKTIGQNNEVVIATNNLGKGLWLLNLTWHNNGKAYMYKKDVVL